MLKQHGVAGMWAKGPNALIRGQISDYRAGLLVTEDGSGSETVGLARHFRTAFDESGDKVLVRILRPPTSEALRYGALREAIAAAHSVGQIGFQETRAWDGATDYIVDSGEGACGVVRFGSEGCVGAMINKDPHRRYDPDLAAEAAPAESRESLATVCRLPLLTSEGQLAISAIFWSAGGQLLSAEPWPTVYAFGGEVLRHEMLPNETWRTEATAYYELDFDTLTLFIDIATRRLVSHDLVVLAREQYERIVPVDAEYRDEAAQLLDDIGIVRAKA